MVHRALLAPAFGLAIASCYGAGWLFLGRALTPRALAAIAFVALAGTAATVPALLATRLLARRPWTARFAAAFIALSGGTVMFTALLLGMERAWATHPMAELGVPAMVNIILRQTAAALYNVLSLAAFVLLPLGLPTTFLFAWVLARAPSAAPAHSPPERR